MNPLRLFLLASIYASSSVLVSCVSKSRFESQVIKINEKYFAGLDGCALIYNFKEKNLEAVYGKERCQQRLVAASTFKMPLALMAFDSGILKDENTKLKWDGVSRQFPSWNQDHTAESWMQNSVVWYSQRLTTELSGDRIQTYLKKFNYGNQDFSAGLTSAWLTITKSDQDPGKGSLKISAYEQLEFLKKFWGNELPVSKSALEKTKKVTFLELSAKQFVLHGKTGSGYFPEGQGDFGWFIGHVEGHDKEYLVVTTFSRHQKAADVRIPGLLAKDMTKSILSENSLW